MWILFIFLEILRKDIMYHTFVVCAIGIYQYMVYQLLTAHIYPHQLVSYFGIDIIYSLLHTSIADMCRNLS